MKRVYRLFIAFVVLSFSFSVAFAQEEDTTRPTVSIDAPQDVQNTAFEVTITFSEPVNNFVQNDIRLIGGTASGLDSTNAPVYTVTITPDPKKWNTFVSIRVNAAVAEDDAGNLNIKSPRVEVRIDLQEPITIVKVPQGDVRGDVNDFDVIVSFGEPTYGFTQDELQIIRNAGEHTAQIVRWRGTDGSSEYTATIRPGRLYDGFLSLGFKVEADVAQDAAGNYNLADTRYVTIIPETSDVLPPTFTIEVPTDEQEGAFTVTITASEPILGFTESDLQFDGFDGVDPTIENWTATSTGTGEEEEYTFILRPPASFSGQVGISIPANVAQDAAGNGNTHARSPQVTVTPPAPEDTTLPTVEISNPSFRSDEGTITAIITFSEPVIGFTPDDISLSGVNASVTRLDPSGDRTYRAIITPTQDGTVTVSLAANVAQDAAGNWNTAAESKSVEVDVEDISVSISAPSRVQRAPFDVTVRFSAPVPGFEQSDLSVAGAGASITNWEPHANMRDYSATITPTTGGEVELTVDRNVTVENNMAASPVTVIFWPEDVNQDGYIGNTDLLLIAIGFGRSPKISDYKYADVDRDGDIDIDDFRRVVDRLGQSVNPGNAAPAASLTRHESLQRLKALNIADPAFQRAVQLLEEQLIKEGLGAPVPEKTVLLANYPNPFNPETWIPYRLAKPADVTVTIYAANGEVVRTLALGHQRVGSYLNRTQAAYWDGKNAFGEKVASGLYFYTFTADDFSATRKMLILK